MFVNITQFVLLNICPPRIIHFEIYVKLKIEKVHNMRRNLRPQLNKSIHINVERGRWTNQQNEFGGGTEINFIGGTPDIRKTRHEIVSWG